MSDASLDNDCCITFTPPETFEHRFAAWTGLRADVIAATQRSPFSYRFKSTHHLLIATELAEREHGETSIEGLPPSRLRRLSGKLTFVPAGHAFYGWQAPRVLTRAVALTIDPCGPLLDDAVRFADIAFQPRLFFSDPDLWRLTGKIRDEALKGEGRLQHYGEALAVLLGHELIRLNGTRPEAPALARGGLAAWQRKKVADYIEAHLSENLSLATLASLIDFSPYHFARAFKQSFGEPPHRYHMNRRIERAKELLVAPEASVTGVALAVGFAETSSFSAAFRRSTGFAPSNFRRGF